MKRAISIFVTTILIFNNHSAFAFDPNLNNNDFNSKIEELNNSISTSVRLEILRTGSTEVSWIYPNRPIFKAGAPETNQKALDDYSLAVKLIINKILEKLKSLPTAINETGNGLQIDYLGETQFNEKITSYAANYFESSRILILKKAAVLGISNYFGYRKKFSTPDFPTYTGIYKTDMASLSEFVEKLRKVQMNLDESFDQGLIITTSILDNKSNFSNDSFEGFLIRIYELSGKYEMKFQSVLDKNNFICKDNHSCSYNYSNKKPNGSLYSFDPGSQVEREKEFNNQENLWANWLNNEINNISKERYMQEPYSDSVRANNCSRQSDATKNNLDSYQSTFNAIRNLILQQNSNPDAKERDAEFRDYLTSVSKIKIGLSIWQEKLPIYFKRDSNCNGYQVLLEQTNNLVQEQKELVSLLKTGKNVKNSKSNLVFDQKQYDTQAKKVDQAIKTLIKSIPKKTIVCVEANASKKVTGLSPICPAGYKKK